MAAAVRNQGAILGIVVLLLARTLFATFHCFLSGWEIFRRVTLIASDALHVMSHRLWNVTLLAACGRSEINRGLAPLAPIFIGVFDRK
jgi:hypothetical protein